MPDLLTTLAPPLHAGATVFMVGLVWFVQIVHYPLMAAVPPAAYPAYAAAHQRRTTWVVGPVMLVEALTAAALVWTAEGNARALAVAGAVLLAFVWVSTFGVQVPLHAKLLAGFDGGVCRRLVMTNWVRTAAWTARGVIALVLASGRSPG